MYKHQVIPFTTQQFVRLFVVEIVHEGSTKNKQQLTPELKLTGAFFARRPIVANF
jgi:hypothetical protein